MERALIAVVICCTVGYALHAAPSSLSVSTAGARGQHHPSFSMQTMGGARPTVCESGSDSVPDGAAGDGACMISAFSAEGLAPGSTATTRIKITATGLQRIDALSLRPLTPCSQDASAAAHDFCQHLHLRMKSGSQIVFDGSAAELGRRIDTPIPLSPPRAHHAIVLSTEVSLPETLGNSYQALTARLPLLLTASG